MCGGLKKRYILTALVCFGAVMSGGGFAQAESTTTESRSETRTTVDRNGTIAERVRRTESRTTVSSETKDSDAIRNMAAEQRRQMERMGLPHTGDRELNEKVEYQYESGVVLNELLAPLVVPNRNVPKSIGTWAGMTFQNDRIIEQGILAKCKSGGKWGILGTDGKELIAPAYKEILDVNDRTGVIHSGRDDLNQYKAVFAHATEKRSLADALEGADVFVGLSGPNLLSAEGLKSMAANPIVFACSNPDPEIAPELAHATRDDVIMATGRSDYPNQVNNVLGFPFIFRGALDVRAKRINEEMKIAAANALRELAKLPVPQEVCDAYGGIKLEFGREYIIPKPMDVRLITLISDAVAKAAIETGVATLPYPKNYPLKSVDDVFNG